LTIPSFLGPEWIAIRLAFISRSVVGSSGLSEAYNQTVKDVAICLLVDHRLERNLAIKFVHNAMERKRNTLSITFFVNLRREIEDVSGEKELT